jgi:copper homeostasis protein
MTLELCIDSLEGARLAAKYGLKRIELCSALSVGGLTPSLGLTRKCAELDGAEVHVMLRIKEGHFHYSDEDISAMGSDLKSLKEAGAIGVVFGCLTSSSELDARANRFLVEEAKSLGLEVTFHRAFDFTPDPKASLEQLIDLGFDRLLTSGQKPKAIEGAAMIQELSQLARGRIQIMAGSGVNAENSKTLASTGVDALHFTAHSDFDNLGNFGMGARTIPDENKVAAISTMFR